MGLKPDLATATSTGKFVPWICYFSADPEPSHREIAISVLKLAASGKVREAYSKYVSPNLKHHNPYFRGDRESLMLGMEENATKNPNKTQS